MTRFSFYDAIFVSVLCVRSSELFLIATPEGNYADDMLTQRHAEIIIETFEAACWLNVFTQRNQLVWGHLKITILNAFSNGIQG